MTEEDIIIRQYFPYLDDEMLLDFLHPDKPAIYLQKKHWTCTAGVSTTLMLVAKGKCVGKLNIGWLKSCLRKSDKRVIPNKRAYIYAFSVAEEYQDKGYGQKLLERAIEIIKDNSYTECTIIAESTNEKAKHIYTKFGFDEKLLHVNEAGYSSDIFVRKVG